VLYVPELHERLTDRTWDEAWVRDAIARIVADAVNAYDPDTLWPANESDAEGLPLPLTDLYSGAAGVVWALDELGATLDLQAAAARTLAAFVELPDTISSLPLPEQRNSSLLAGETGIAFVAWRAGTDDGIAERLLELVRANVGNRANELLWGVPGTLLVARAMLERTGEERWRDAVAESEADLSRARDDDGLWTQHLYGHVTRYLGPAHGFVANAFALGASDDDARVLREHALHDGEYVNWPPLPGQEKMRVQWCHGAPGILATAASYLDEDLLLGGAKLIWHAGPLETNEKGPGLCHGTAGNGYGLLKAFERTEDELWLERARAFAVHALEQAEALPPRYALFTGGVGAALFATDCLEGAGRFPFIERL
jgi:lantibiotic modifying enzyme